MCFSLFSFFICFFFFFGFLFSVLLYTLLLPFLMGWLLITVPVVESKKKLKVASEYKTLTLVLLQVNAFFFGGHIKQGEGVGFVKLWF